MAKKPEENEEEKQIVIPRAVSNADMLNHLSDKIDVILNEVNELKKLASEE